MTTIGTRTYSAAHFALELDDNQVAGIFKSVEGGGVKTQDMKYQMGNTHATWKQLGKPKYEPLTIEVAMAMSSGFYSWIESFFAGRVERRNGALIAADFKYEERARREFHDAIINKVVFPTLKGEDKNAAYMKVTIEPGYLRWMAAKSGAKLSPQLQAKAKSPQQLWTASNFEFSIGGFEAACARCSQIDSFTITQQVLDYHAGNVRDALRVPGLLEFPNVSFMLPEADAKPLIDHFTTYGIKGGVQPSARLTAGLDVRDHKGNDLCTISMSGCDITSVTPDKGDASTDSFKQVKFEMAVESMAFKYKAAT